MFIAGIEKLETYINIDDRIEFLREPDNQYDEKAILIRNANGIKLGYVPTEDNLIFARLMGSGKLLFGKISKKDMKGNWPKIEFKIYLKE